MRDTRSTPRRAPPSPRSAYDPHTRLVTLAPHASPYQLAHERSHEHQHRHRTLAWRCSDITHRWPYVSRLTRLWCEWEATRLALGALRYAGYRDGAARREARAGLLTYVRALVDP